MKLTFAFLLTGLAAFSSVSAAPATKKGPNATDALNLGLLEEYMNVRLLQAGLKKYNPKAFKSAGKDDWVRPALEEILREDQIHVAGLKALLGKKAIPDGCYAYYDFKSVNDFLNQVRRYESLRVSSIAQINQMAVKEFVNKPELFTITYSLMAAESKQEAAVAGGLDVTDLEPSGFVASISPSMAYTALITDWIEDCIDQVDDAMPWPIYGSYVTKPAVAKPLRPGSKLTFTQIIRPTSKATHAAFISGINTTFVKLGKNNTVTVPKTVAGDVFVLLTKGANLNSIAAGPEMYSTPTL